MANCGQYGDHGEVADSFPTAGTIVSPFDMSKSDNGVAPRRLTEDDLVPDEPLRGAGRSPISDSQDLLHHRVIATKVAELATSASGKVNIALFGPWGAGKSSFNELLGEEIRASDPRVRHITFDAWKNAGEGFRTNFLSELAKQIPKADQKVSDQLFQATTKVTLPFLKGDYSGKWLAYRAMIIVGVFLVLTLAWTAFGNLLAPVDDFPAEWWQNIRASSGFAAGSTILVVVGAGLLELSKVTVSKSTPSHVAQFSVLFDHLLNTDRNARYVIFIDELDRCGKNDVMATLEGLRTFLGHERCVFVVAFDRASIATTIAEEIQHSAPNQSVSPYYRTSGEYLDKIFQFQLALPPQPAHTFRRYALSLVKERGGVWAQLREHEDGLLDRIVAILSPMHLSSPRRTKVLLNDFAVNSRLFESLNFSWRERAEEIAVLTVIQTEFPNLMSDIERAPSLMRFLFRNEVPTRPEIVQLFNLYRHREEPEEEGPELDQVVGSNSRESVAQGLQANLDRYLRRLREMVAPEPRVDLILMHSDGNLLHFEDPDVYNDVLLAADLPRQDVVQSLGQASAGDRALAIDHILEQAEPESTQIALSLRILAGELAVQLPLIATGTGINMRAAMRAGLGGHTSASLEGYARAVAVSFDDGACAHLVEAAEASSDDALEAVVQRLVEDLNESDWSTAHATIVPRVLAKAARLPGATAAVLRRMGQGSNVNLEASQITELASSLSVRRPTPVEPAASTVSARQEADAQNAQQSEEFAAMRSEMRGATEVIIDVWPQLPVEGGLRRDLLQVLRLVEDGGTWHLDKHDQLIRDDKTEGHLESANNDLLTAIAEQPHQAAARWRELLSDDTPVSPELKMQALEAVVRRATSGADVAARTNGAGNAFRLASLPSSQVSAQGLLSMVAADLESEWEEYTDDRFESLSRLLDAIDLLRDSESSTSDYRRQLYVDAVTTAQLEDASVEQIVAFVRRLRPADAALVAEGLTEARLWEEDYPERSVTVLLAAQERALGADLVVQSLPASAVQQLPDPSPRRRLQDAWLATAPALTELAPLIRTTSFSSAAWQRFGERVSEERRAETWDLLASVRGRTLALKALSTAGQSISVYEGAASKARDAGTKPERDVAVDQFLALPFDGRASSIAQALVKTIAAEGKRTEVPLGLRLIQAYHSHWSKGTIATIRPLLTPWAEAGESYLAQRDIRWLVREGYIGKKSSIWQQVFGRKR